MISNKRYEKSCGYDKARIEYVIMWNYKLKVGKNLSISIDLSFTR